VCQLAGMADHDERAHLIELIEDFDIAMLATTGADGTVHARPMAVQKVEANGDLVFCTGLDTLTVEELHRDARVAVVFQGKTKYASLSGTCTIDRDRSRIHALWKEDWKVWFPEGKDDPNLCLLDVNATEGEFWDASGMKGIKYLFKAAKAYLTGEHPRESKDQNAKVAL
jgi:general stress protein 26